jgi:predicted dehydrogenase
MPLPRRPRERVRVAVVGGGFIAKAHAAALHALRAYYPELPAVERLLLCDATEELARKASARLGFAEWAVGWEAAVAREDVDLVVVATPPDLHRDVAVAAVRAGKDVLCEKPLARNAGEAAEMLAEAARAGVLHVTGFNHRQSPLLRQARRLTSEGALGDVFHVTGRYFQDYGRDPSRPANWRHQTSRAGGGAVTDAGSHLIDAVRLLAGDVAAVTAMTRTVIGERPAEGGKRAVEVEDYAGFLARFDGGAGGVFELSRIAPGRRNQLAIEVHGSRGSLAFDSERMNELQYFSVEDPAERQGFRRILAGPAHPPYAGLLPVAGLGIGFFETFLVQAAAVVRAMSGEEEAAASLATFEDGWRVCRVTDAVLESGRTGSWVEIPARGAGT